MRRSLALLPLLAACADSGSLDLLPADPDGSTGPRSDPGAPSSPEVALAEAAEVEARAQVDDVRRQIDAARASAGQRSSLVGACTTDVAWRGSWFARLQDAVDAGSGPVLLICPGTYAGPIRIEVQDVVVAPWKVGRGSVTLTGGGRRGVVRGGDGHVALVDLVITGGGNEDAVQVLGASPTGAFVAIGNRFVDNHGDGALEVTASSVVLAFNDFEDNVSAYGGGAAEIDAAHAVVLGNRFVGNDAGYESGALSLTHRSFPPDAGWPDALIATIGNRFEANHSGYEAGAVEFGIRRSPLHAVSLLDVFVDNEADHAGGAVAWSPDGGTLTIAHATFERNAAPTGSAANLGNWNTGDVALEEVTAVDHPGPTFTFDAAGGPTGTVRILGGTYARNGTVFTADDRWSVAGSDVAFGTGADASDVEVDGCGGSSGGTVDFHLGAGGLVCP